MAYTPKTWVCGEKITADGLNNIEEGIQDALECCSGGGDCGYECTEISELLTEESVTTANPDPSVSFAMGNFSYSSLIDADTLIVTFNGTEYEVDRIDLSGGAYGYGGMGSSGPDFTNYPFAIASFPGGNQIYTENEGTYNIKIVGVFETITASDCFGKAVRLFGLKYVKDANIVGGVLANDVNGNTVTAQYALAEGKNSTASGTASHAEGRGCVASGDASHAQGSSTTAQGYAQTAIGEYNVAQGTPNSKQATDYAFIVGNGTAPGSLSNALAIKWDGTFVFANGTEITPAQFASLLALL